MANLDGADHVEPVVEETLLRFRNAVARREAVELADDGRFDQAAARLEEAALACAPYMKSPAVAEESRDLRAQAELLKQRTYSSIDRKYDSARSMSVLEAKMGYVSKMSRRR